MAVVIKVYSCFSNAFIAIMKKKKKKMQPDPPFFPFNNFFWLSGSQSELKKNPSNRLLVGSGNKNSKFCGRNRKKSILESVNLFEKSKNRFNFLSILKEVCVNFEMILNKNANILSKGKSF